ncbi:MAG: PEP-utilizing enzyme [Acidobacteria bacterium]|nr:PEP-utilizing enzyme [Acidobacteriota bacterium]
MSGRDRWRPVEVRKDSRASLSLDYLTFKDLTTSNDELLETIADIECKLEGDTAFGMAYLRNRTVVCATHTYRMIICLDKLSSRRYQELHPAFASMQKRLEAILDRTRPASPGPPRLVYQLSEVDGSSAARVGGKSANIGEIRNRVPLPIPDGFAVSTDAFAAFLDHRRLGNDIRALQLNLEPEDPNGLHEVSQQAQQRIMSSDLPPELAEAILAGYDQLSRTIGYEPRVSVRSSAVGEDGEMSFAGQYTSVLNVDRAGLIEAYKEVVASLYSPQAMFYRGVHGIPDDDLPMGALCMTMVDAVASGVACSVDPNRAASDTMLISGAWGLGVGPVGGSVSPDTWVVSRTGDPTILTRRLGWKETRIDPSAGGGVAPTAVPAGDCQHFSLSDVQVQDLARLVGQIESHYHCPQEIEWALDRQGQFVLLQTRPLQTTAEERPAAVLDGEIDGHRLLLTGAAASRGCGSGVVHRFTERDDPATFPDGAVLVTRHSSPQFVKVMDRASAIVTDIGATTGHMASLAREFGVPAVLDTRNATRMLAEGVVVTVDANGGGVYEGRVERLLASSGGAQRRSVVGTPIHTILREVATVIVPLALTDPRSPQFHPRECRSFHDIARFVHEKAFEEMFRMSDRVTSASEKATRLDERLPYLVYLIDIGGGLRRAPSPCVRLEDIRSEPMRALLQGMMHPELRWWEPRPISMSGFLAVATESMLSPGGGDGQRRLGDRSYAIVAEAYCNFSSRVGYHFAAVDAYCSESRSRNYVSFRFKGGAADDGRRARRCELIGEILRRLDFQIEWNGDLVNARLLKFPRDATLRRIDQIGRLIVATRQLDMRLGPGTPIAWYVDAFFAENYLFEPPGREMPSGQASASREP